MIRIHGSFPNWPFKILPKESYKRSPIKSKRTHSVQRHRYS